MRLLLFHQRDYFLGLFGAACAVRLEWWRNLFGSCAEQLLFVFSSNQVNSGLVAVHQHGGCWIVQPNRFGAPVEEVSEHSVSLLDRQRACTGTFVPAIIERVRWITIYQC